MKKYETPQENNVKETEIDEILLERPNKNEIKDNL
jgi:hypothetical protein